MQPFELLEKVDALLNGERSVLDTRGLPQWSLDPICEVSLSVAVLKP